jgi:MoaA/NifB/PqqE/SkfB family radical SAM enzyme
MQIVEAARAIGLDSISFLGADVSSTAFNRPQGWEADRVADVALSREETVQFAEVVETTIEQHAAHFKSGFIVESPQKLREIVQYYEALNGDADLPEVRCNAPWVSAVIEADGTVRPCFFHQALGNIDDQPLVDILNSSEAISFRRDLDLQDNPICRKCVCSLHLPATASVER